MQVTAAGDTEGGGGGVVGGVSRRSDHAGAAALLRIHSLAGEKVAEEQDGGDSLALKEITRRGSRAEAAPCRTSPGGDVFAGFAGKKPFRATTFTDEGTKAKGALQRSHSAELGAATAAACGAPTEERSEETCFWAANHCSSIHA